MFEFQRFILREKEGDTVLWRNPYTNRKFKNELTTQKRNQNFDYTTIMDSLRIVSWSNNSHPTVVVKPVYGTQPSQ